MSSAFFCSSTASLLSLPHFLALSPISSNFPARSNTPAPSSPAPAVPPVKEVLTASNAPTAPSFIDAKNPLTSLAVVFSPPANSHTVPIAFTIASLPRSFPTNHSIAERATAVFLSRACITVVITCTRLFQAFAITSGAFAPTLAINSNTGLSLFFNFSQFA